MSESNTDRRAEVTRRLNRLLEKAERSGFRQLTMAEITDLGTHYRAITTHLAQARTSGQSAQRIRDLNALAARAHGVIYGRGRSRSTWSTIGHSLLAVPAAVRSLWRFHLIAVTLFVAGSLYGCVRTQAEPEWALTVLPPSETRTPYADRETLLEPVMVGRDKEMGQGEKAVFTSFLWQNNTRVALISLFSGFLLVPPVLAMFYNGLLVGCMTAPYQAQGLGGPWWAWILPHGVTEILAIILLGGGGLAIGYTVLVPGARTRIDALLELRRKILPLLVLVFPMLFAAALIESYLRQSSLGDGARFAFAAGSAVFWVVVLGFIPAPRIEPKDETIAETRFALPSEEELLGAR